jgi:hypothetical protein
MLTAPVAGFGEAGLVLGFVRRFWWAIVAVAVVVIVIGFLVYPQGRRLPPPRARQYRSFDVCLLTGPQGLADGLTAAVWAGMQDASRTTQVRVSYLAASGPQTVANALPYGASLLQQHCGVIVAVGGVEVAAAAQQASAHSSVRFVLVGSGLTAANVSVVEAGPAERTRSAVAAAVTAQVS